MKKFTQPIQPHITALVTNILDIRYEKKNNTKDMPPKPTQNIVYNFFINIFVTTLECI